MAIRVTQAASNSSSLPPPLQLEQVIATADMPAVDEDLRDGHPAASALDHFLLSCRRRNRRHISSGSTPSALEQRLGPNSSKGRTFWCTFRPWPRGAHSIRSILHQRISCAGRTTRAQQINSTRLAPARNTSLAQASAVLPLVRTSSTSTTFRPWRPPADQPRKLRRPPAGVAGGPCPSAAACASSVEDIGIDGRCRIRRQLASKQRGLVETPRPEAARDAEEPEQARDYRRTSTSGRM